MLCCCCLSVRSDSVVRLGILLHQTLGVEQDTEARTWELLSMQAAVVRSIGCALGGQAGAVDTRDCCCYFATNSNRNSCSSLLSLRRCTLAHTI